MSKLSTQIFLHSSTPSKAEALLLIEEELAQAKNRFLEFCKASDKSTKELSELFEKQYGLEQVRFINYGYDASVSEVHTFAENSIQTELSNFALVVRYPKGQVILMKTFGEILQREYSY